LGGNLAAGSEIAFWPNAGYDWNLDGFNSGSEYVGQSGSGRGDTYLALDLRLNKAWVFGKGMSLDTFLEVFNLTNAINYGLHVDQRQASAAGVANTDYNAPTGSTVGQPRTFNVGLRFRF
jgi:hypothetical protein